MAFDLGSVAMESPRSCSTTAKGQGQQKSGERREEVTASWAAAQSEAFPTRLVSVWAAKVSA